MRRQSLIAIFILVVAVAIAVLMVRSRPTVEPQPVTETAPLVETSTLRSSTSPLEIVATGTVSAQERVIVASQVGGQVLYVNPDFVEGEQIDRGDVIIRLDRADFENRVRSAKADLAAQDVNVMQAEQDVQIARSELAQFDERFSAQQSSEAPPQTSGFRPPEQSNVAIGETSNVNTLSDVERSLATREPQLQSAIAARDRAAAGLSDAELALKRTVVTAPFSGLVQSETVSVGSIISAGQSLGELVSSDVFEVQASLSDQEAALIPGLYNNDGEPLTATIRQILAGQTVEWPAEVSRVSAVRDPQTRRVEVFLTVKNPLTSGQFVDGNNGERAAPPLFIGSLVDVLLSGAPNQTYALIDTNYLRTDNQVWLVEDGRLRIVQASLILRSDNVAAITFPGLSNRHTLVTSDLRAPVDGMNIRLSEAD
ncbi:MAG: HlyD family efflux transporter periplasmic adaptor subunit [Pseudomonadota bacterium]